MKLQPTYRAPSLTTLHFYPALDSRLNIPAASEGHSCFLPVPSSLVTLPQRCQQNIQMIRRRQRKSTEVNASQRKSTQVNGSQNSQHQDCIEAQTVKLERTNTRESSQRESTGVNGSQQQSTGVKDDRSGVTLRLKLPLKP